MQLNIINIFINRGRSGPLLLSSYYCLLRYWLLVMCPINFLIAQSSCDFFYLVPRIQLNFTEPITYTEINHNISREEENYSYVCKNGELFFYSNGIYVWDKFHNQMPSQPDLPGYEFPSTTQQCIISHNTDMEGIYNVFSLNTYDSPGELYSFSVDMRLNSGLGDLVFGSETIIDGSLTEQMFGVSHPCNGLWILSHLRNSATYVSFHISNGKMIEKVESSIGNVFASTSVNNEIEKTGSIYLSQNDRVANLSNQYLEFSKFNRLSGQFYDPITVIDPENHLGNAIYKGIFSKSGNYFYLPVVSNDSVFIRQYDLEIWTKKSISERYVDVYIPEIKSLSLYDLSFFGDKIYFTIAAERGGLSSINNPEAKGASIDVQYKSITYPQEYLGAKSFPTQMVFETEFFDKFIDTFFNLCKTELKVDLPSSFDSILWNTNENTPSISPVVSGLYSAKLYKGGCIYEDSVFVEIPVQVLIDSVEICDGDQFFYKGETYEAPFTIYDTLRSESCDTLLEIKLLASEQIMQEQRIGICAEDVYLAPDGNLYRPGEVFTSTKSSTTACDTLVKTLVTALPLPNPMIEGEHILCFGAKANLLVDKDYNQYAWNTGDSTRMILVGEGSFEVKVMDSLGCEGSAQVTVIERPQWLLEVLEAVETEGNYLFRLDGDVARINEWNVIPSEDLFLLVGDRLAADGNAAPGLYRLEVKDEIGCISSLDFEIPEEIRKTSLAQSNVLNIQAVDPANRKWQPQIPENTTLDFVGIYDRWGNEVFNSRDASSAWNGNVNGKPVAAGNYVYVLRYNNSKGRREVLVGSILVMGRE